MLVDAEKLVRLGCKKCRNTRWIILEPKGNDNFAIYACDKCGRGVKVTESKKEIISMPFELGEIKAHYIV